MKRIKLLLILPLIFLYINTSYAQQLRLSIIGAVSKETGVNSEQFNWGFSAGGNLFFYLSNNFMLGVRSTYSRWTPNESEFTDNLNNLTNGKIKGNATVIEIVPSIRLTTNYSMSNVNLFMQAGAGAFIFNNQIIITGTSEGATVNDTFGRKNSTRFGIDAGLGLTFGNLQNISVDLYPLFNFVFLGENNYLQYFTFNIAIGIGI